MSTRTTLPSLLLGPAEESWGDERERSVMLEAYAYVFILTTIVLWTVGAVVAWFIPAWVTIVLFVAFAVPSLEWARYCSSRDVDVNTLAYGGSSFLRTALSGLYFGACAVSMALAAVDDLSPDDDSSSLYGAITGGVVGAVAVILVLRLQARRKLNRTHLADDE